MDFFLLVCGYFSALVIGYWLGMGAGYRVGYKDGGETMRLLHRALKEKPPH